MICRTAGEVSVETPLLIRSRPDDSACGALLIGDCGEGMSAINTRKTKRLLPGIAAKAGQIRFRPKESPRKLQSALPPEKYTLSLGVYNALETLLRSTAGVSPQRSTDPSSLLSTCLRNMHHRIKLEEDWEEIDAVAAGSNSTLEKQDISGEIYTELEAIGSSGSGWKHLRAVIRAHGVNIVSEAIRTGLLCQQFGSALVMLCVQTDSLREAEVLLTSLLFTIPNVEPATPHSRFKSIPAMSPLLALEDFVKCTDCNSTYFRILTRLFSSKMLKITWLASKDFGPIWARIFRALSGPSAWREAAGFLETVLLLISDASAAQRDKGKDAGPVPDVLMAISTTFSSVLATLSAVVILDESVSSNDEESRGLTPRGKNVVDILQCVLVGCAVPLAERRSCQLHLACLANLLTKPLKDVGDEYCLQLIGLLQQYDDTDFGKGMASETSEFLCSVARCCGRGVSNNGFEHIKRFGALIEACSSLPNLQGIHTLRNIAVDGAYLFAQKLPNSAHLAYAEDISGRLQIHHALPQRVSPCMKNNAAFRWEEGISEWVAPTPLLVAKHVEILANFAGGHDYEIDSPLRPYRRAGKPHNPSLSRREQTVNQHPHRRVTDLVPSSPGDDGRKDSEFDSEDSVFSDTSCRSSLRSVSAGESITLHNSRKEICRVSRMGPALSQPKRDWALFIDKEEEDEEEDELGSMRICVEQTSVLAGMSNRRLNTRQRQGNMAERWISLECSGNIDISDDELGF